MPRARNPYLGLLSGLIAARYDEISQYSPEDLVLANFHAIQALLAWQMDANRRFEEEEQTVRAALDVLVEQERITQEYAEFVKTQLAGWTLERLTDITTRAQSLPVTASRLREEGDLGQQVKILQEFMILVLQSADSPDIKALGMQTLQQLKLQAGLSQESMDRMLALVEAAQADDDEDDVVDVEAEEE